MVKWLLSKWMSYHKRFGWCEILFNAFHSFPPSFYTQGHRQCSFSKKVQNTLTVNQNWYFLTTTFPHLPRPSQKARTFHSSSKKIPVCVNQPKHKKIWKKCWQISVCWGSARLSHFQMAPVSSKRSKFHVCVKGKERKAFRNQMRAPANMGLSVPVMPLWNAHKDPVFFFKASLQNAC